VRGARFDDVRRHGRALALAIVGLMAITVSTAPSAAEDSRSSVDITIQNAVARVGEKAVIVAKISVRDGLEITSSYRHRISGLSPSDGIELEREVVRGVIEDGSIVFTVGVTAKRAGTHTVRGVFRFSYHNGRELDIRSGRFEATVTATE
jgi:hypothetical protein